MLPDHFYMAGIGVYLILYLPAVLVFLWSLWRQIKHLLWPVVVPLGLVLASLPFWDVYMISLDASRLCKDQGGLHVYKTVETDGFLGGSAERWLKYGFSYIEGGGGKFMSRYTMQEGEIKHQRVEKFISRYSAGTGDNHKVITSKISRLSEAVIDRETQEVLGDLVYFSIHPGWFDSLTLGWAGMILWHCGNESPDGRGDGLGYGDVVKATLKPRKMERVE